MEYNPLDTMISTMKKHGANMELKQKMPDGSYRPAPEGTIQALGTQAKIAATASILSNMTKEEKTQWAISKKNEGNELYSNHCYNEAIETYLECITATEFGDANDSNNQGNIDDVVVPVLCNLAACSIQTKDWGKVVRFCDQCLLLRSNCFKALLRRGIAYFHVGEYKRSLNDLNRANEQQPEEGNDKEKEKLQQYLFKAEKGLQEQEKALLKRKKALQAAFNSSPASSQSSDTSKPLDSSKSSKPIKWNKKDVVSIVICVSIVFVSILVAYLRSINQE